MDADEFNEPKFTLEHQLYAIVVTFVHVVSL